MKRLLLLLLLPLPVLAQEVSIERDNVDIAPAPGVTIKTIEVDNRLGNVTVIGRDAPGITLSVVKKAPDAETLERLKINLVPDPNGAVSISSALLVGQEARPIAPVSVRVDITVIAPRNAALDVKAWSGTLAVEGMRAGARLLAHDGQIDVKDVRGLVTTTTMRGNQRLRGVMGSVWADDTYGDLTFEDIAGDELQARVHRGQVTATQVRSKTVRITTTFGDIRFTGELLSGGIYELRSFRGNVEVRSDGAFRIDAFAPAGIESRVELAHVARPEEGRMIGTYGSNDQPAMVVASSRTGRVLFGLIAP
ncbi:MAG TPA: DUF4097 family beta strand repeat-containing protein [Haliangiales bacterium]|nr:DUF4097 family beta strand repeat-containing protein [Haliangiales bacterium]